MVKSSWGCSNRLTHYINLSMFSSLCIFDRTLLPCRSPCIKEASIKEDSRYPSALSIGCLEPRIGHLKSNLTHQQINPKMSIDKYVVNFRHPPERLGQTEKGGQQP